MKKFVIVFLIIIILIISSVSFAYFKYKENIKIKKAINEQYESYISKEITGVEVATLINKAVDSNRKNIVEIKDGIYQDNGKDSIKIDIKFKDLEKTFPMETIYSNGVEEFILNYRYIKFKSIEVDYHEATQKISYIKLEQQ